MKQKGSRRVILVKFKCEAQKPKILLLLSRHLFFALILVSKLFTLDPNLFVVVALFK